jgi:hypothetical protein
LLVFIFAGLALTVLRWVIDKILPVIQAHTSWPGGVLGFIFTLTLAGAAFAASWIDSRNHVRGAGGDGSIYIHGFSARYTLLASEAPVVNVERHRDQQAFPPQDDRADQARSSEAYVRSRSRHAGEMFSRKEAIDQVLNAGNFLELMAALNAPVK